MYSLWFVASRDSLLFQKCTSIIEQHASELKTPRFVPHVTLVGLLPFASDEEAIQRTKALAKALSIKSWNIGKKENISAVRPLCRFQKITSGELYYQCVYALCELDKDLLQAQRLAVEVLGLSDVAPYMPHLSLVYGDLPAMEKRVRVDQIVSSLAAVPSGSQAFSPTTIELWKTPIGETEQWQPLASCDFTPSSRL